MSAADRASFGPTHDCFAGLVLGQLLTGHLALITLLSLGIGAVIRHTAGGRTGRD